jgi:hypothetical protein
MLETHLKAGADSSTFHFLTKQLEFVSFPQKHGPVCFSTVFEDCKESV